MNIEELNLLCKNTLVEHLGIEFTALGNGWVKAIMPIDSRTHQPQKRLHGGASMALAESIGGAASMTLLDNSKFVVFGVDINGSHVGSTEELFVLAEAKVVFQGKSTHVCEIKVSDKNGNLISICRLTNRILPIKE